MHKKIIFLLLICILFYTRFAGLSWGLPYPMHPDERNMVNAVQQLSCEKLSISNCLNPHFFAYGQFPLYLAYFGIQANHFLANVNAPIGFDEATMALRIISAIASILNVFILYKILFFLIPKKRFALYVTSFALLIFSPYAIQFSHFGTTESLLMLFYSIIIYLSLKLIDLSSRTRFGILNKMLKQVQHDRDKYFRSIALFSGLAIATKVSSVIFLAVPIAVFTLLSFRRNAMTEKSSPPIRRTHLKTLPSVARFLAIARNDILVYVIKIITFLICVFAVFVIFSPHNIISFPDFISSINYESSVALGGYVAFYTRQFTGSTPLLFQFTKIFPYALGWPQYILAILGFFLLSWKNKYINLLRFALLVYLIPTSFMFAKWSRFMAPVFPIMSVFAILIFYKIYELFSVIPTKVGIYKKIKQTGFRIKSGMTLGIIIIFIIPGLAYLSIYQNQDVRFEASQWIYQNIPAGSKILSETANVVDIPVPSPNYQLRTMNYQLASFNFYDLDENPALPVQLDQLIEAADYIIIPSRRIFANHPKEKYPLLNNYYSRLFSGSLGFEKVAEFSSYPKISLFGKTLLEFPDENAEETWTVFDHPVIRIYKKMTNDKSQITNQSQILNLKNYQTIRYTLRDTRYTLLLADSPEKWEKGLMYVRNKEDIGGLDGMLFQFPDKKIRTFWNKNTVSSLDLYWIDGDKVVGTSKLPAIGESGEITTTSSPQEVDKVIELL